MQTTLTQDDRIVACGDQVSCDLAGEEVILHLESGIYYGLDPVGAHIWKLIQTPRKVAEIQETLLNEYDVDASHCQRELLALLEDLASHRLIKVRDEQTA